MQGMKMTQLPSKPVADHLTQPSHEDPSLPEIKSQSWQILRRVLFHHDFENYKEYNKKSNAFNENINQIHHIPTAVPISWKIIQMNMDQSINLIQEQIIVISCISTQMYLKNIVLCINSKNPVKCLAQKNISSENKIFILKSNEESLFSER